MSRTGKLVFGSLALIACATSVSKKAASFNMDEVLAKLRESSSK